jgi:hypothetical protein
MQRHNVYLDFKVRFALFLVVLVGVSSKTTHPFHVSVTEIRCDASQKAVSLSCKMFTDDLQDALFRLYHQQADLHKKEEKSNALLLKYISERVQIKVGSVSTSWRLLGYEIEEEAVWCYLEAELTDFSGQVQVKNTLLYDFLPDQTNLIHFFKDGHRTSHKLVNPQDFVGF